MVRSGPTCCCSGSLCSSRRPARAICCSPLYEQSAENQLKRAEHEASRSCHDIADRYAVFAAGSGALDDGRREDSAMVVEGGVWAADRGSLAYAALR